jgi:Mn-dependent DtxR family transcriptional regulator
MMKAPVPVARDAEDDAAPVLDVDEDEADEDAEVIEEDADEEDADEEDIPIEDPTEH